MSDCTDFDFCTKVCHGEKCIGVVEGNEQAFKEGEIEKPWQSLAPCVQRGPTSVSPV